MAIGADRTGKPPLKCSLLLHSSLTPLPDQWDHRQSCKYTLGATFIIISQNFLIACHKSFAHATITRHNIKHVLWCAIAACVAFCSRPGLLWSYEYQTFILPCLQQTINKKWLGRKNVISYKNQQQFQTNQHLL